MKTGRLAILLTVVLLLSVLLSPSVSAAEITASGTCGEALTWTLDSEGTLTISGTGEMPDFSSLGEGAAPWGKDIVHVQIDPGVTSIGNNAFTASRSLVSVSIPDGVTSIGDGAFSLCRNLTTVNIPEGVTVIGKDAFSDCYGLSSVIIPSTVTSIGKSAFSFCSKLTTVNIPEGVTGIDEYTFWCCFGLESISIPEGVTYIEECAFDSCASLTWVTIPGSVSYMGDYAFGSCSSLDHVLYTGSQDLWLEMNIGYGSDALQAATLHLNATGNEIVDGVCSACNSDHQHSYTKTVTAPACESAGYTTYTCSCGDTYVGEEVPALGHSWGQWVETVAPTETADGMNTRVCTACGQTEEETVDNNIFTDVKADRFEEAILWAFYNGITSGTGDGTTFSPENPCTRKQIVTFLWRAAGEPEPASMENPFTDVKADRFEKAILWAYCEGITSGTGDGTTFSPETPCTRKQIVTFLWRAAGEPEPASMENPFTDVKSDRFEKAILWAAEKGITTGTGDGSTFSPENSCTRKQIVTFLYREMQSKLPADPVDILEAIYALELGEALPYPVTLTGVVYNIDQQYTGSNEGAFLDMKVADKEYVSCLYLTGEDMIGIRAGDVISVTGTIRKYNGLIVFEEGCVGVKV